jgi:predicted DsbA family dithiol-disulfide isomerase
MVLPDLVPNTRLAMAMGEYARDRGDDVFWRVHQAIFAAYFGSGRDIGRREVLLEVARAEGLDPEAVVRAWDEGTYDARLHEFHHLALQLGIATTPSALICNELLIGTRPYGILREAVTRCLVTPASLAEEDAPHEGAGARDGVEGSTADRSVEGGSAAGPSAARQDA